MADIIMDEEEPTQPATQIVTDPRRLGQGNSGFSDEDLADICCVLHPMTIPAAQAAVEVRETNPHLALKCESNVRLREKDTGRVHEGIDEIELESAGLESYEIVLRLSTKLKDPCAGFFFGRNAQRCDYTIGQHSETKRISNVHFRIYINEHGTIMLEDQSTNGTAVDGHLLRGKEKENGKQYRHMLEQGSVVVLTMTPPEIDYRFLVRIPIRDEDDEVAYQHNLTAYFLRMKNAQAENEARAAGEGGPKNPVNLFPNAGTPTPRPSSMVSGRSIKEWKGGPKYNRIGTIGKGAFAVVYKITDKFDGVPYAAKELEKRRFMKNGILDQKVDMEMKIMRRIQHPNVVRYIEHVDWEEYLYIIMEYVPGGDLGSLINEAGKLSELDVKLMATQLLSALKHLHSLGITHRDVKPDNILIYTREPLHVKLTDFGLSKMIDSEETFLRTFCGTLLYCAPEVYGEYREYDENGHRTLRGLDKRSLPPQRYGHAVDVWSTAGVLFYSLSGSPPYPVKNGTSYQQLLNQIMTKALDIRPLQRAGVSENGIRFVRSMLHVRPELRATIEMLENTPWMNDELAVEDSMEVDEVDLIASGALDRSLEQRASQLSFRDADAREIGDSEVFDNDDQTGVDHTQQRERLEIPSSFSTGDGSYSFGASATSSLNGNRQPRLFGEVNLSALGSSGAIPADQLDLPLPITRHPETNSSTAMSNLHYDSQQASESRVSMSQPEQQPPPVTATMAPPPYPRPVAAIARLQDAEQSSAGSSSLMGAESMVGKLQMNSPASAASAPSPNPDSPAPTIEEITHPMTSHRRGRDEFEQSDDDDLWKPADLPPRKLYKSARAQAGDVVVPYKAFWDMQDRSTHHQNYPKMKMSELTQWDELAKSKGETFEPGNSVFEHTMHSFRSSRSPSRDPEYATRAYSEPLNYGPHLMQRDERKLAASEDPQAGHGIRNESVDRDRFLPGTNAGSPASTISNAGSPRIDGQPFVGNDFQPPKRILAKVVSTPDSCLPTISLNLVEPVTAWGRGYNNTIRYGNGMETRIPKYAFKILLYKPGFYDSQRPVTPGGKMWTDKEQDMTFYISTKSSFGIWVNNTKVPAHDPQAPSTASKYWGALRHGDIITAWFNNWKRNEYVRFKFDCLWGRSKELRSEDNEFKLLEQGDPLIDELDKHCFGQELILYNEWKKNNVEEYEAVMKRKRTPQPAMPFTAPPPVPK